MQLREYQHATLDVVRADFRSGMKRVVLYAPTGSGKSEMAIEMARLTIARGGRVAFIVNRKALVEQAVRRFGQSGSFDIGIVQAGNTCNTKADVLVCSLQTLESWDKYGMAKPFDGVRLFIIDEAHEVIGRKSCVDLMRKYSACHFIGLSATPFTKGMGRFDKDMDGAIFEGIAKATTIRELIDLGFLVDCDIYAPEKYQPDLSSVSISVGDFNERELGEAMDKQPLIGGIVEQWEKIAKGKPTIVFATSIAHSQHITEQFCAAGYPAEHIDCNTLDDVRQGIIDRLQSGQTKVISNVQVLSVGWDCPIAECMVLARPTRSLALYIQMVGRVLRPFHGKDRAVILDHSDTCTKLGFPTDDLPLELDDGKRKAKTAEAHEKPLPKACPGCGIVKPAGKCPRCGFEAKHQAKEVEHEAGDLAKMERKPKATMIDKQDFYSELLGFAGLKGKNQRWVDGFYKGKFGVWPRGMRDIHKTPSVETIGWIKSRQIAWANSKENRA